MFAHADTISTFCLTLSISLCVCVYVCVRVCTRVQVQPHPCDRDYQHADGMKGCSPVFMPSQARSPMGLVHMDTGLRMYLPKSLQHGTHAQTLERSGFVNMLGRPPFNYSDGTPFRRAGFMSTDRLLDDKDATIFKPCKTVRQCFEDKFTHHGVESTRRVYIRGEALGANANTGVGTAGSVMRDWQARDASKCGIFGTWLVDDNGSPVHQMCPGKLPTSLSCFIFHTRVFSASGTGHAFQ